MTLWVCSSFAERPVLHRSRDCRTLSRLNLITPATDAQRAVGALCEVCPLMLPPDAQAALKSMEYHARMYREASRQWVGAMESLLDPERETAL